MAEQQLVGRRQELVAIDGFLGEEGGLAALLIEGEAGIGKTRLWQEGVERARARGFRVLVARPVGAEVRLSFAGLGDLLGGVATEVLADLPRPQRHGLEAALLLAEPREPLDPRVIGVGFLGVLKTLAHKGPVLVAVDDLQWLDRSSGELLAFALRRLDSEPVRLLAGVRAELGVGVPRGVGVPFQHDRVLGETRLRRLPLGPLSLGALYELVRTRLDLTLDRAALVRLHETSAGNPFFALEIGRELLRRGVKPRLEHPLPVPGDLRVLLRERLARLPERTQALLVAAAALPRPTVALLEATIGSADEVAADLEPALQAGVIEQNADEVRFTHPLLASVFEADAPAPQRRQTHARLAEVAADPEARARHMALAGEGPNPGIAHALEEAAKHASSRGAPQAAAELWEAAVRFTPSDRGEDRRRCRSAAAHAHHQGGDLAGARLLLEEVVDETPRGSERAELLLRLARTRDDDLATAIALCKEALEEAAGHEVLSSRIHRYLSLVCFNAGGPRKALLYARQALELAERVGDTELLAPALARVAWLELATGDLTGRLLERTLALEDAVGLLAAHESPSALHAYWLAAHDRVDEARERFERELARAAAEGDEIAITNLLDYLTQLEVRAGNWARADELATMGFELYERRGLELQGSIGLFCRALVDAHLGRAQESRSASERGAALAAAAGDENLRLANLSALGFLELSLGDTETAAEHLSDVRERLVSRGMNIRVVLTSIWADTIEALIGVGKLVDARACLGQYEELARPFRSRCAVAIAARCSALVCTAEGNEQAAQAALARAFAEHERLAMPFELARTLLVEGQIERRLKRWGQARASLEHARAAFAELGAPLWVVKANAELARLGGRRTTPGQLSETEARVAELAARGLSNKELAASLFLSEKTVEANLARVYRKLGVRSRTQLGPALSATESQATTTS